MTASPWTTFKVEQKDDGYYIPRGKLLSGIRAGTISMTEDRDRGQCGRSRKDSGHVDIIIRYINTQGELPGRRKACLENMNLRLTTPST